MYAVERALGALMPLWRNPVLIGILNLGISNSYRDDRMFRYRLRCALSTLIISIVWFLPSPLWAKDRSHDAFPFPNGVEGTLEATDERQRNGELKNFNAWKNRIESETGISFGFDNQIQYLGTNSSKNPSDAATNVLRFYSTWTAFGRGTPNDGALIFKAENRSAVGGHISPQALGPSLGYAGLFSTTFSDAGWVLTNLYWRQRFADGQGAFVVGQVDVTDYVDVNNLANPWTAFTNLAFEQMPTLPAPSQGMGAAVLWRFDDNWAVLAGFANANADPADPLKSNRALFETGETFKHVAVGWSPDWGDRYDQLIQLTFWQVDQRQKAGVEGGQGVAFTASGQIGNWRPFLRAGYADGGGTALDRSVSVGTGYDTRGGKDLAGLGLNWGRAPGSPRDQFTMEAFYRYDPTDFLQITPSLQYVVNPANDPAADDIAVFGLRVRTAF